MSFTTASGAPVVRIINGISREFVPPKRDQVGRQIAAWAAADKVRLKQMLDECNVDPSIRFAILKQFDQESRLVTYGMQCAMEFERSGEIVRQAAGIESIDEFGFTPDEVVGLALELWGFPDALKPITATAKTEGPDQSPLDRSGRESEKSDENRTGS